MARLSTHRLIQLDRLHDEAGYQRVRHYCCAINAASIGNRTMAMEFNERARRWEEIRIKALHRIQEGK